ncbi:MAG: hypothetical protein JRF02_00380 [Deltaproteobacteria bacterium]|jgi:hypothetical protein|nr:hypothetical protein [Deltaproteobacteria bacterium]
MGEFHKKSGFPACKRTIERAGLIIVFLIKGTPCFNQEEDFSVQQSPPLNYHKVFFLHEYLLSLIFFFIFFGAAPFQDAIAEVIPEDSLCCNCHKIICEDNLIKDKVHRPFLERNCSLCHVYDDTVSDGKEPELIIVNVPDHLPMRSKIDISISVCTNCHAGFAHSGNHSVKVRPSENVIIPEDFSLGPDGSITCITCHTSHSSEYEYRMRFCYIVGNMQAGRYPDIDAARAQGGCLICHAEKGVLPKNRNKNW